MTNRAHITRQAARDGVPAPTVERDYVLAHLLSGRAIESCFHGPGVLSRLGAGRRHGIAQGRCVLIARPPIRQMASPLAHRSAAEPN